MNEKDSAHNISFVALVDLYVEEKYVKETIKLLEKNWNERNS